MSRKLATRIDPVKRARMLAHEAFDPLWESGLMSRSQAYGWLSRKMRLPRYECHMRYFGVAECRRVVAICRLLGPKIESLETLND